MLEVRWRGIQLWGSIEILPTQSGHLLRELYSQGVRLGVSSRGWATLRPSPLGSCMYIGEDFELITFDFVTEPSTPDAYLLPIQRRYSGTVPPQDNAVRIAHLGHGSCGFNSVARLPHSAVIEEGIFRLRGQQQRQVEA